MVSKKNRVLSSLFIVLVTTEYVVTRHCFCIAKVRLG